MNIAKFLKGTTTIGELEKMPNAMLHTLYKKYVEFLKNEEAQKAAAAEEVTDQIEEAMGG